MRWECSECGANRIAGRRPVACTECGRAGVIFVEAGHDGAEDLDAADVREAWVEAGLRLAAHGAHPAAAGF